MITIRYAKPLDLELSGTAADLAGLSADIAAYLADPQRNDLVTAADPAANPFPYSKSLAEMVVRRADWPARLSVCALTLELSGTPDTLSLFCSFLDSAVSEGSHAHFEYYDDNPYISPDSIPLVIACYPDGR